MPVLFLAVPAEVFVAGALLLLLWAVQTLLVRPIVTLLEHVPLVGGTVGQAVNDVVQTVLDWVVGWVRIGVDAMVQLVLLPIRAIGDFIHMVGSLADTVSYAILSVANVAAGAVGAVADRLASVITRVAGIASTLALAVSHIATLFSRVAAILATTIPAVVAALHTWARAIVATAVGALNTALRTVIAAIKPWALLAIAAALAPLQALLKLVPAQIAAAIAVAVHPLALGLEALRQAFGQAIGAILARLSVLEKLLPLLLLVPLVSTITRTIEQFWRTKTECVDPTCNLLGDLLGGLGAAGELLSGSVLIYLVEESIRNPEGAASEVHGWAPELRGLASEVTTVLAGRPI